MAIPSDDDDNDTRFDRLVDYLEDILDELVELKRSVESNIDGLKAQARALQDIKERMQRIEHKVNQLGILI